MMTSLNTNNVTVQTALTAKIAIVVINKVATATVQYKRNGVNESLKVRCTAKRAQTNEQAFELSFTDALAHLPKAAKVAVTVKGNISDAAREQLAYRPTLLKSSKGIVHQLA